MATQATTDKERLYVVNLRNGFKTAPLTKRGRVAMKYLRDYFAKTLKDTENISISKGVNESMLRAGPKKPLNKIKVRVKVDGETATIMLPDEKAPKKKKIVRKTKPVDTKTKLQEMLAAKSAQMPATQAPKEKEDAATKPEPAKDAKKEKPASESFEEQVAVDKKPASGPKKEKVKKDDK